MARWAAGTRRGNPARSWCGAAAVRGWNAAALAAVGSFCALVQGPQWRQSAALATVNLAVSLVFVFTGLMLRREPGQRVRLGAHARRHIPLGGFHRCLERPLAGLQHRIRRGGPPLRRLGVAALPQFLAIRLQRRYLVTLTGWMLVGRTLIAVTSTAQWNGDPPSCWWPALVPDQRLSDVFNYVVHGGEGSSASALMVLLVIRLMRTRGLDRIVIAPIIVAGIAAVIAATASAAAQMMLSLSATPNGAYLTESVVDFAIPVAFLIAVVQRLLLVRNVTELTAQSGRRRHRRGAPCAARHAPRSHPGPTRVHHQHARATAQDGGWG